MPDELLPYFDSELTHLRLHAKAFAEAHPHVAKRLLVDPLSGNTTDPHVERLLEGVAYLTARIRKKLDDSFPELTQSLFQILYPQYLAPTPSMGIAQFHVDPDDQTLTSGHLLPRHTSLDCPDPYGTRCWFRTATDSILVPLEVIDAGYETAPFSIPVDGVKMSDARSMLWVKLSTMAGLRFDEIELPSTHPYIRFFLGGDLPIAHTLYELLFNHLTFIGTKSDRASELACLAQESGDLDRAIRPVGFDPSDAMLPSDGRTFGGYRLLTELFTFPQRFLFFDIDLREAFQRLAGQSEMLLVWLFNDDRPRLAGSVDAGHLLLNCAPIVNLFSRLCDAIELHHRKTAYQVFPDAQFPQSYEIYSVNSVTGVDSSLRHPTTYEPFFSYRHATSKRGEDRYWHATRQPLESHDADEGALEDYGTDLFLSIVDSECNPAETGKSLLHVEATCSNRRMRSLVAAPGQNWNLQLNQAAPLSSQGVSMVVGPTPPCRPPLQETQWRLASHLLLNHLSISEGPDGAAAFRELLSLYNFSESSAAREAIRGVTGLWFERKISAIMCDNRMAVLRGLEILMELDELKFKGDHFLFASVMERFLPMYASVNSFTEFAVRLKGGRPEVLKRWPPRVAERTLM